MNLQEKNMIYGTHLDRVSMSIETGEETAGVSLDGQVWSSQGLYDFRVHPDTDHRTEFNDLVLIIFLRAGVKKNHIGSRY